MIRLYALSLLLHTYIGARLLPDLANGAATLALALLLVASAALVPTAFLARRGKGGGLAWIGMIAAGLFSTLIVLTIARDVLLLLALPFAAGALLAHWSAAFVPIASIAITLIGFINARRTASVRNVDVPIDGLPLALHGFTIAQISDVHVGQTIRRGYVESIVDKVNALDADLIAVTGDLVDGSVGELASHTAPLARLSARHGTFFVTGNHEYYSGARAWIAELTRLGLNVLQNEHVVVEHDGANVVVAGVTDYSAHHFDQSMRSDPRAAIDGAPPDAVKVLLAHQPRSAFEAAKAGFDLQLSGHTHGGQFLPWNWLVKWSQPFTAGLSRLGRLWVYTSRGTGYWGPPKRFGAPSEITRLCLVPAG
ncbi:MAG TPA: metallophosphoesterase [Casimicrobiaceae bacterium]|nr:metallophosphoesterase [Casimicrobiaceae bacterium]